MHFILNQEIHSQIGIGLETFSLRLNVRAKVEQKRFCYHRNPFEAYDWNYKTYDLDVDSYRGFSPNS